ncbi:phosphoadenosine phosphosulfate reductase domain-containing protein, partial [Streptococcus sobrinus]|uniref:phosphoadenosine phosphosulfate reductase domain-containing protein n=1 Tax=Streptococcus sobrinus TaxID=1310 RepID=UPI0003603F93
YLSVSGGKDSSVMLQLCAKVAREMNKTFSVLYIDLEAQYKATIDHIEELREENKDVIERFYWCCLPLSLRNAVSVI